MILCARRHLLSSKSAGVSSRIGRQMQVSRYQKRIRRNYCPLLASGGCNSLEEEEYSSKKDPSPQPLKMRQLYAWYGVKFH